ncbi:innexin inx3-like [Clytia hemisphaerica]|uniref:Innexin n=1 Tax=Clytia hemisphaerica TaxID=252671 RepID=A0A7M6DPM3_9CNID
MTMGSIGSIKDILSIKIKHRHDSYTDQFCRIFMSKMFIISALVMGVDFFNDKVSCIVPKESGLGSDFVHSACWIQGFYIYTEMMDRIEQSGYYGIPKDIDMDGLTDDGRLCRSVPRGSRHKDPRCNIMHKTFFLQFQWMPFFISSLALLQYFPYLIFRIVNTDIISLKTTLKSEIDTDSIVKNYFNYKINSILKMRIRIILNVFIKMAYVCVTVMGFWLCDMLLNGNFYSYGTNWIKWTKYNNSMSHDIKVRNHPKPGNVLLPPMGFCEIHESSRDVRQTFTNTNKFVCEISPNILYQYVLIILWFLIVFSIIISISGLLINLVGHLVTVTCFLRHDNPSKEIYQRLTFREVEYLEMIRRHNIPVFGEIVRKLQVSRVDCRTMSTFDDNTHELESLKHDMMKNDLSTIMNHNHNNTVAHNNAVNNNKHNPLAKANAPDKSPETGYITT